MPEEIERALRQQAHGMAKAGKLRKRKGEPVEEAMDRFVYGTMRSKHGWKPSRERR